MCEIKRPWHFRDTFLNSELLDQTWHTWDTIRRIQTSHMGEIWRHVNTKIWVSKFLGSILCDFWHNFLLSRIYYSECNLSNTLCTKYILENPVWTSLVRCSLARNFVKILLKFYKNRNRHSSKSKQSNIALSF